jgi:hypothetical protein
MSSVKLGWIDSDDVMNTLKCRCLINSGPNTILISQEERLNPASALHRTNGVHLTRISCAAKSTTTVAS